MDVSKGMLILSQSINKYEQDRFYIPLWYVKAGSSFSNRMHAAQQAGSIVIFVCVCMSACMCVCVRACVCASLACTASVVATVTVSRQSPLYLAWLN